MVLQLLGFLLLLIAAGTLTLDIVAAVQTGVFAVTALGDGWFWLSPGSLNLLQAVIERYVYPPLWDPIIISILKLPISLISAVLAAALLYAAHRSSQRGRIFKHRLFE